ncbi:MAG: lysoplasmalogenase [Pirellulales bacterium]|nr:lysoplasmalogenase [Pirellulales bacterium]
MTSDTAVVSAASAAGGEASCARGSRAAESGLWGLWAALLFGGFLFGVFAGDEGQRMPASTRLGSSAVLVVAAWGWLAAAWSTRAKPYSLGLAVGMTLGFVGDLFNWQGNTLGGIIAFGIGHISYIAAQVWANRAGNLTTSGRLLGAIVVWQLIGLVAWAFVVWPGTQATELRVPALPYSLLLAGTTGVAMGLALGDRRFWGLAAGAVLFLVSDFILAFRIFHGPFAMAGDAVWLSYGPGQMLIVYSVPSAVAALARKT